MSPPRYRTLDGDEVELPLAMGSLVIVPRALARFDPELAWTLDYEDGPEPDGAAPRLDFSDGALLVPVDRWNEHAELEPNLAPCHQAPRDRSAPPPVAPIPQTGSPTVGTGTDHTRPLVAALAAVTARSVAVALAALATGYVLAVRAWLWTLRDGISGPDVSTGLVLVGAAVLLAWLAGLAGVGWPSKTAARPAGRAWPEMCGAVLHLTD